MIRSYIALGSNLGDPREQLTQAMGTLSVMPGSRLQACSPAYRSEAVGPGPQPQYLNAVVALDTTLTAAALLSKLQAIESSQGRRRHQRWAARTLDLDILLYADNCIDDAELTIPHPRMRERNFVLFPLYDIAPEITLPCGTTLESLVQHCPAAGLELDGELRGPAR